MQLFLPYLQCVIPDAEGFSAPEWAMIELQGEIVSQQGLAGQTLGDLTYVNVSFCSSVHCS
eukprot:21463-Heterococcus_DN1.PRE.5